MPTFLPFNIQCSGLEEQCFFSRVSEHSARTQCVPLLHWVTHDKCVLWDMWMQWQVLWCTNFGSCWKLSVNAFVIWGFETAQKLPCRVRAVGQGHLIVWSTVNNVWCHWNMGAKPAFLEGCGHIAAVFWPVFPFLCLIGFVPYLPRLTFCLCWVNSSPTFQGEPIFHFVSWHG